MHPHAALVHHFYEAFAQRDAETMAASYHRQATFSDPVFPELGGERIGAMWGMLCARGADLEITFGDIAADDTAGSARWEARYTFSATGRQVHNVIAATFEFRDGLLSRHVDRFDFWRWSRQALGLPGLLLGWSPLLLGRVRRQADRSLRSFERRQAEA